MKLLFLIPTKQKGIKGLVSQIRKRYPACSILIVDDGAGTGIEDNYRTILLRHERNLGLAQSLLEGYNKSLRLDYDVIVRLDADKEYPIFPLEQILSRLDESRDTVGAFVELKRSVRSNGIVDFLFHSVFGFVEGMLILGYPMSQHSPGLQVYKRSVVEKIVPKLNSFQNSHRLKWALDLVVLKLASRHGKIANFALKKHEWSERRPLKKVVSQFFAALVVLGSIIKREI